MQVHHALVPDDECFTSIAPYPFMLKDLATEWSDDLRARQRRSDGRHVELDPFGELGLGGVRRPEEALLLRVPLDDVRQLRQRLDQRCDSR